MNLARRTAATQALRCVLVGGSIVLLLGPVGCGSPSAVNNKLRADNQALQEQIDALKRDRDADRATIKSLEERGGTAPTLPQARLDKLFTVYGIKLGRLTGGDDWDPD